MKWKILFFVIISLILIGFLFLTYLKSPKISSEDYNLTISAEFKDKKVKTGFQIGDVKGNTSQSNELIVLKEGNYTLKNINIENQNFYQDEYFISLTKDKRIVMKLDKPSEPEIDVLGLNPLVLEVYSENYKELDFCLRSSTNYIFVKAENYTEIESIEDWKRCYDGDVSLKDSSIEIQINYEEIGQIDNTDFIEIILMDKGGNNVIRKIL